MYSSRGVHGQAVENIAERVLSGRYAPGETFDVQQLGVELGVSRTVVREALKVLGAKGLVDARPKRGTFVRPRSEWSLLDSDVLRWQFRTDASGEFLSQLAEVRGVIEPAGARLAAERRNDSDLAALHQALEAMAVEDGGAYVEADLSFHRALLAAAHNELLQRMEMVVEAALEVRGRMVHEHYSGEDSLPTHQAVVDAVQARDPLAAHDAMLELLSKAEKDSLQRDLASRGGD